MEKYNELAKMHRLAASGAPLIKIYGDGTVAPKGEKGFVCKGHSVDMVAAFFQSFGYRRWAIGNGQSQIHMLEKVTNA